MTDDPDAAEREQRVLAEAEAERQRLLAAARKRDLEIAQREQAKLDEEES